MEWGAPRDWVLFHACGVRCLSSCGCLSAIFQTCASFAHDACDLEFVLDDTSAISSSHALTVMHNSPGKLSWVSDAARAGSQPFGKIQVDL